MPSKNVPLCKVDVPSLQMLLYKWMFLCHIIVALHLMDIYVWLFFCETLNFIEKIKDNGII